MMTTREEATAASDRTLVFERVFDAPRELVWRALTEPELVAQWYAPEPMTMPLADIDFRVGGRFRLVMRDENGVDFPSVGEYLEIDSPARYVATDSFGLMPQEFADAFNAALGVPPETPFPVGVTTVTLDDLGDGRTRLGYVEEWTTQTIRDAYIEMQMIEGLDMTLDHLAELLAEWQA
jgi:uncharacterized protein YndB with AHSA1/START domain